VATITVDRPVGAVAPVIGGGYVLAAGTGFLHVDAAGAVEELAQPEAGRTDVRMNDGACDPQGRFWAGTMAYDESPGAGGAVSAGAGRQLYHRADRPDHLQRHRLEPPTAPPGTWPTAGPAWSRPSASTARPATSASAAPWSASSSQVRSPDGLTVDQEGGIWVALWGGGAVQRYGPDGALLTTLRLPVDQPTSCAFGGAELATLFVATARAGLDEAALDRHPTPATCSGSTTSASRARPVRRTEGTSSPRPPTANGLLAAPP
jgi:sugar lactone lactonase YvrE